ncbi:MAG: sigma-70 family RNA polymerase sigma factor [Chitinophagaceae bacterium]|nr:sigma-70 family RNA polymerase sigma factor [Chitinophagaceae bacterium]
MGTTVTYNEPDLVSLLKSRDDHAFAYLYDNYSGALYGIILQIVNNAELSNDVLQEVFINIWRKIETYDSSKGRLYTWMLNIARNASIDTLRSKSYQNSQKNQSLPENVDGIVGASASQPNPDLLGLRKMLGKLKDDQRVLIELAYFKGYTHEEISQIEEIPLGTVKTRIRNALMQLRSILK